MYENIFPGLALDEAKAFAGVEPLDCSLFFAHFVTLFSFKSYLVPRKPELGFSFQSEFVKTNPETLEPAVFSWFSVDRLSSGLVVNPEKPSMRAQKKAASLTRDRFTTSKAIQEQQTQEHYSTEG